MSHRQAHSAELRVLHCSSAGAIVAVYCSVAGAIVAAYCSVAGAIVAVTHRCRKQATSMATSELLA